MWRQKHMQWFISFFFGWLGPIVIVISDASVFDAYGGVALLFYLDGAVTFPLFFLPILESARRRFDLSAILSSYSRVRSTAL